MVADYLIRFLGQIYEGLLVAYPPNFRRRYGREMALAFRDRAREIVQDLGPWALVPFVARVIGDWGKTVIKERVDMDPSARLNWVSGLALSVLALTALAPLLVVAVPAMLTGRVPAGQSDEGTAAHIFQLSILLLIPTVFCFLATADWTRPMETARRLIVPIAAVVLAFSVLFVFERVFLPAHELPPPRAGVPLQLVRRMMAVFR